MGLDIVPVLGDKGTREVDIGAEVVSRGVHSNFLAVATDTEVSVVAILTARGKLVSSIGKSITP